MAVDDGAAHPGVRLVPDQHHPGVIRFGHLPGGLVGRRVVHHDDVIDQLGHSLDRFADQGLFIVGRDDGRDDQVLVHAASSPRKPEGIFRRVQEYM
ncbi:hypothetical protein LUX73_33095 [Actinomadura madurae]|nr:hypothetical protein [Actinomadura madurae]MCQ0009057.1 hypothetical protein [Actinomadura madurae]